MEEIIVLHTYTMKNLYISLPFRIHQLLIYILSFFTIPTRLNADIDLTKYLEKTGLTMRTVANYISNIGQIHEETASGTILPLLKHHRINYEQQSLECELNEQYVSAFSIQFSHSITIPETMLCLNKQDDYAVALRLAIRIANKCHTGRGFASEIKVPMSDVIDGYWNCMRNRWRSALSGIVKSRLNLYQDIELLEDCFITDIDGDANDYIPLNSICDKKDIHVKRLTRSRTRFMSASFVFKLSKYWK